MKLLDLIFGFVAPPVCELCGRTLAPGERMLCLHCLASLPLCMGSREDMRLARLPRTAPIRTFDTLLTYAHDNAAGTLIRAGKYGDRPEIMEFLGDLLARQAMEAGLLSGADAVVAVPMHRWKRWHRGYNQAALVAGRISAISGIPEVPLLKAVKGHRSQTRRSGEERRQNVAGIFAVDDPAAVAGRHIVLIDDILTTGATLSEAIKELTTAGAGAITVLTIAATRQ